MARIKVGDQAPDFSLPSSPGETITLSDYVGRKNIVLYFYPKDFTRGCTIEACEFRDSYRQFKDSDVEVLGISGDPPESHSRFARAHALPFPLLSDLGDKVRRLYGVPKNLGILAGRVTYIIDKQGKVRHIFNSATQPRRHIEEAVLAVRHLEMESR